MFASFTSSSGDRERARDRFFDEPFAQTDPQVAGENFDHVLPLARGELCQPRLQQLRFRDRAARPLQIVEELFGFGERERLAALVRASSASNAVLPASPWLLAMRCSSESARPVAASNARKITAQPT